MTPVSHLPAHTDVLYTIHHLKQDQTNNVYEPNPSLLQMVSGMALQATASKLILLSLVLACQHIKHPAIRITSNPQMAPICISSYNISCFHMQAVYLVSYNRWVVMRNENSRLSTFSIRSASIKYQIDPYT